jgi:hypothetical protein
MLKKDVSMLEKNEAVAKEVEHREKPLKES